MSDIDKKIAELKELEAKAYWNPGDVVFMRNALPELIAEVEHLKKICFLMMKLLAT